MLIIILKKATRLDNSQEQWIKQDQLDKTEKTHETLKLGEVFADKAATQRTE